MKHKIRFLIPACCVGLIVIFIAANIDNYEKPIDATVNPANGDIAINSERDFRKTQQKIPNKIENSLQMIA